MLKEYTLKVTVQVGGETEQTCDNRLLHMLHKLEEEWSIDHEITHEEVVEKEVERE